MAAAETRYSYTPFIGGKRSVANTNKFDKPYGLRPEVEQQKDENVAEAVKLPRIVLKDRLGNQLNTFTTLQEAIYRAELNVRKSGIGTTAQEWRLPHGPLPAKPDYSRTGPTMPIFRQKLNSLKNKNKNPVKKGFAEYHFKDVDVDDVAFVAESLNHLPHVPSLSFLRQEFLAEPKRYFPIVHSILLHQKLLSETEIRDPEYTFPGFCFGCRQHMLCPGCDRTSQPHYHLDKTTGGILHAQTLQDKLKNQYGNNWLLSFPDLLIRKTSKVPSLTKVEKQLIEEELDKSLGLDKTFDTEEKDRNSFLPAIHSSNEDQLQKPGAAASVSTEDEGILADRQSLGLYDDDTHTISSRHQGSMGQSSEYELDQESDGDGGARSRGRPRVYNGSGPRSTTTPASGREIEDDETSVYASSQRTDQKSRLYKAPTPFKLKQRKRRLIKSQSPFSMKRTLDVPKGPGFKVKQSDKSATEFVDFEHKDSKWKEPSKFEVKSSSKDATKFWSPRPQKKKKHHDKRGRHSSPDSGMDSDKGPELEEGYSEDAASEKVIPSKEVNIYLPQHPVEADSDTSESEVRPLLTFDLDLDPVPMTSAEPSLDLQFDAAVDLDEFEFIIEDLPIIDQLQKRSRKKHRKKHQKEKLTDLGEKQNDLEREEIDRLIVKHIHRENLENGKTVKSECCSPDHRSYEQLQEVTRDENVSDCHGNKMSAMDTIRYSRDNNGLFDEGEPRHGKHHKHRRRHDKVKAQGHLEMISGEGRDVQSTGLDSKASKQRYSTIDSEVEGCHGHRRERDRRRDEKGNKDINESDGSENIGRTEPEGVHRSRKHRNRHQAMKLRNADDFGEDVDEIQEEHGTEDFHDEDGHSQIHGNVLSSSGEGHMIHGRSPRSRKHRERKSRNTDIPSTDADEMTWQEAEHHNGIYDKEYLWNTSLDIDGKLNRDKKHREKSANTMESVQENWQITELCQNLDEATNVIEKSKEEGSRRWREVKSRHGGTSVSPENSFEGTLRYWQELGDDDVFDKETETKLRRDTCMTSNDGSPRNRRRRIHQKGTMKLSGSGSENRDQNQRHSQNTGTSKRISEEPMMESEDHQQELAFVMGNILDLEGHYHGDDISSTTSDSDRSSSETDSGKNTREIILEKCKVSNRRQPEICGTRKTLIVEKTAKLSKADLKETKDQGQGHSTATGQGHVIEVTAEDGHIEMDMERTEDGNQSDVVKEKRKERKKKRRRPNGMSGEKGMVRQDDGIVENGKTWNDNFDLDLGNRQKYKENFQQKQGEELDGASDVICSNVENFSLLKVVAPNNQKFSFTRRERIWDPSGGVLDTESSNVKQSSFMEEEVRNGQSDSHTGQVVSALTGSSDVESSVTSGLCEKDIFGDESEEKVLHPVQGDLGMCGKPLKVVLKDPDPSTMAYAKVDADKDCKTTSNLAVCGEVDQAHTRVKVTVGVFSDDGTGDENKDCDFSGDALVKSDSVALSDDADITKKLLEDREDADTTKKLLEDREDADMTKKLLEDREDADTTKKLLEDAADIVIQKEDDAKAYDVTKVRRRVIVKKEKIKDVRRPGHRRKCLAQIVEVTTHGGSDVVHLEGIAENRKKDKSFADADEFANEEDGILTFMSTIQSDSGSTTKELSEGSEITDSQLTQKSEESKDSEKFACITVSLHLKNEILKSETPDNNSNDVAKPDVPQLDIKLNSELQGRSLDGSSRSTAEISSSNTNIQLNNSSSLSIRDSNEIEIPEAKIEYSISPGYENITQSAADDILDFKPSDDSERQISILISNDTNIFHDNYLMSDKAETNFLTTLEDEPELQDLLLKFERETTLASEESELRDLLESEKSEYLIESHREQPITPLSQNATAEDISHDATKQEVTDDLENKEALDIQLHIRSFGESVKDEDQDREMPSATSERPKPQVVSTPSSQKITTDLESPPPSSPLSKAPEVLTWSKFTFGSKVTTPPIQPNITERPPPVKKEKKKVKRDDKTEKIQLVNGDQTESNDFSQIPTDDLETEVAGLTDELPPLTNGFENGHEELESPPLEIPPLPEYQEEKKVVQGKEDRRTLIKPHPKLKEAKLPPPPTLKPKKKGSKTGPKKKGRVPSAEAPVTQEELSDMIDPLDFLTKYCIIHMDRLPFYERIFSNIVESQTPRYERVRPLSPRTGMPLPQAELPQWGKHEISMFHDLVVISRGQDPEKIGLSPPEQYLEKICYTLEILTEKRKEIFSNLGQLETTRTKKIADQAREVVKDITKPNYNPKAAKKGKKKKKKKGQAVEEPEDPMMHLTMEDITDDIIMSRIDEKTMKVLCKEPDICQIDLEMERCNEKLNNIEDRMLHLDGEKNILGMYCMEVYFLEQLSNQKPVDFRRAQSALYNKTHPHPDVEMNVDELEGSLQVINNNLLSTKEFQYLFHILNLPGRRKLNFQLFSIIAALSEKVTQMDPVVRKLINKMDYHALDHKMNRSKDLFALICDGEPTPRGNATASNLAVELTAGGLNPEHVNMVLSKFNREGSGYIDFLDFVMYIPLFIEIHERIIRNPLGVKVSGL